MSQMRKQRPFREGVATCLVARPATQATIRGQRLNFVMWITAPGKEFR
jgi:hypothetical protein